MTVPVSAKSPAGKSPAGQGVLPVAIERWDGEGGAIAHSPSPPTAGQADRFTAAESDLLQWLGLAVVEIWNDLPTKVQRTLFEAASTATASEPSIELRGRIACFLREHKNG